MYNNFTAVALFIAVTLYPRVEKWEEGKQAKIMYAIVDYIDYSDDQKAQLYATLAENLRPETKFSVALNIIKKALFDLHTPA